MLLGMGLAYQIAPIGEAVLPVGLSVEGRKRARVLCDHVANMSAFFLAASLSGVPGSTANLWRARSPEFQQMLAAAEERRTQLLESEAWRRAVAGSDTMLIFMLKAARPAVYKENWRVELSGPDGAPLELSDPQRAARIAALLVAMQHKQALAKREGQTVDAVYREVVDDPWA